MRRFPLDGGLLLLDQTGSRLFAYNDTARHAWDLIEAGLSADQRVAEFAQMWGIPVAVACRDLDAILMQWRMEDLLVTGDTGVAPPTCEIRADADRDRPAPAGLWASEWTCTFKQTTIDFAVETALLAPVRAMLAHLETPGAPPEARIEIVKSASGGMVLLDDGAVRIRTHDYGALVGGLWLAILERIHPSVEWLALIHGAAVARNGVGVALCGPSGSGKSTLTAGLISAGFDYLADDLVAVSAPHGTIVPWPVPLSVKSGSFDVIALYRPELVNAPRYRTKGMDARFLVPPPTAWEVKGVRLRRLVFPRFTAGAAADLQRLSTFQAIERLLKDRIWIGHPITEDRVAALLTLLRDVPAYAASYGTLDDGMRLIEDVA